MSKYLELFKGSFNDSINEKTKPENKPYIGYSLTEGKMVYTVVPKPVVGPADNEIWYTTVDGTIAEFQPYQSEDFGGEGWYNTVVSNVYEDGKGIITFEKSLEKFSGEISLGATFYDSDYNICYNDKLTSLILPSSVKTLESFPFSGLDNIPEIVIPNSVISLGSNSLVGGNTNPKHVYNGTISEFESISKIENSFNTYNGELIIYCTDGEVIIPAKEINF